jgi:DNA ligase-1
MKFPILYKYTTKGQVQQWQIFVSGNQFYAEEGLKGGKLTTSLPTVCSPKNVGKKNETTANEQAILEAKAKHQKKLDKGYNEVLTAEKKFFEPMLAKDYKDAKIDWKKDKVFVQPKLDGLRCINEDDSLTSRNGKPYVACPHLYQNKFQLDGELYNHKLHDDFNKIVSLCKKQKPTEEELEESAKKVEMWVYDMPSEEPFSKRYENLTRAVLKLDNPAIKLVPTKQIHNEEQLKEVHEKYLEMGFEGTIVRIDGYPYENKRSKSLLKYKDFIDEEFKILEAVEGEGGRTGTIGYFVIELEEGKTCKSNVKGDFEYLTQVWKDRKKYIGTDATVKYFNRTPDGSLRFPYITKLNRKEYE